MKQTKEIKNLLARDEKIFSKLHQLGFDFQRDFTIIEHQGNFTYHLLQKNYNLDYVQNNIYLLVTSKEMIKGYFDLAKFERDFNIDINHIPFYGFGTKKDFESVRKNTNTLTFIVYQNKNFMLAPKRVKKNYVRKDEINHMQRYTIESIKFYTYDSIQYVDLKGEDNISIRCNELNTSHYIPNKLLDNSGYIVGIFREKLRARLREYKIEKDRKGFQNLNWKEEMENLKEEIKDNRERLANMILFARDYQDLKCLDDSFYYLKKACSLYEELENEIEQYFQTITRSFYERQTTRILDCLERI